MLKVLVTGRIGSGKSEVCKILRSAGFLVYDSDSAAKSLYTNDQVAELIEREVGVKISELKSIFNSKDKLEKLESIVHPLVLDDFRHFVSANKGHVVVFESAIATDKPLFKGEFDKVILVRASNELREGRNPAACKRDSFQKEPSNYDYLIENNGSMEDLKNKVNLIIKQL